ncbi:MAG: tetratricopeptide repeat protein [Gemmatimonadales bacterium]|jgi:predicted negative regulator of RcsB-dependent stress response
MAEQYSQEDRFVASVLQLANWAQKNTRTLVVLIVALLIGVFGVRYYFSYQTQLREAASAEIRAIRYDLQTGQTANVVDRLRTFLIQFENTPYSREARLLLAQSLLMDDRAAEAVEPARRAADKVGSNPLSSRAAFLLAAAYEQLGETAQAIAVYEDVGRRSRHRAEKRRALEAAARLRAASGDLSSATALYEEILALLPDDSPARAYFEMRAAEVKAQSLVLTSPESADGTAETTSSEGG